MKSEVKGTATLKRLGNTGLTQQFIDISVTIDTWATCFVSYWVIFRPSKNPC